MKEAGLPEPIFDTRGFFTVTFMKRVKGNIGSSNDPLSGTLNGILKGKNDIIKGANEPINSENDPLNGQNDTKNDTINDTIKGHEIKIIDLLRHKAGLSGVQIAENLNLSLSTVMRAIKKLVFMSLIEYRGSKKTGGYYLKNNKK